VPAINGSTVKVFNTILVQDLVQDLRPKAAPDRRALPIAADDPDHLSTRQYARIVKTWVTAIGLDPAMHFFEACIPFRNAPHKINEFLLLLCLA
jgi:hypothetical protein